MLGAQQMITVPSQLAAVQPGQLTTAPGVGASQIGDLLNSIMPLILIMMVFMMITPMMKGMSEGFKGR
jgi:hypothetical protein